MSTQKTQTKDSMGSQQKTTSPMDLVKKIADRGGSFKRALSVRLRSKVATRPESESACQNDDKEETAPGKRLSIKQLAKEDRRRLRTVSLDAERSDESEKFKGVRGDRWRRVGVRLSSADVGEVDDEVGSYATGIWVGGEDCSVTDSVKTTNEHADFVWKIAFFVF